MTQQTLGDNCPEYQHGRAEESAGYVACPDGATDCKSCHLDSTCNPREKAPIPKPKGGRVRA